MSDFLEEAEKYQNELYHHGVWGQRWGVRRYQYKDGSLTPEGRAHWGIGDAVKGVKKYVDKKRSASLRRKKNAIIARADVKEIEKKKHLLTEKELAKAYKRAGVVQAIKSLDPDKISAQEERAAKLDEYRARTERGHIIAQDIINSGAALASIGTTMAQGYFALRTIKSMFGPKPTPSPTPTPTPSPTPSPTPTPTPGWSSSSSTSFSWNNPSTLDTMTNILSDLGDVPLSSIMPPSPTPSSTFSLQDLQDYDTYD